MTTDATQVAGGALAEANNVLIRFRSQQGQYVDQHVVVEARYNYTPVEGEWLAVDVNNYDPNAPGHTGYVVVPVGDTQTGERNGWALYGADYASAHPQIAAAVAEITRRIGRPVPVQINLPADKISPDTPAEWSRTVLQRFG